MAELLANTFAWGKPGFPILAVAGLSTGTWVIREVMEALGSPTKNIQMLNKVIALSIVFGSVWVILDPIFRKLQGS